MGDTKTIKVTTTEGRKGVLLGAWGDNNNNSSGTVKDPKDAGTLHNQKGTDHLGRLLL